MVVKCTYDVWNTMCHELKTPISYLAIIVLEQKMNWKIKIHQCGDYIKFVQ